MKFQEYPAGRSLPDLSGVTEGHDEASLCKRAEKTCISHTDLSGGGLTSLGMNGRMHIDMEQIFQKQLCSLFLFL